MGNYISPAPTTYKSIWTAHERNGVYLQDNSNRKRPKAGPSTAHFLDKEALKLGCYISDLRLHPALRQIALLDLYCSDCPYPQRVEAVRYLFGITGS